jgi:hypothetical protein
MTLKKLLTLATALTVVPNLTFAFNSGSTGADGAFSPAINTTLPLPPNGVFNFTTVNIPAGVTVTFTRNAANTPVVILASGNVTIAGTLSVNGNSSPSAGTYGDGNQADDGLPGLGGPGGYDGGRGGVPGTNMRGSNGLGPGGGFAGDYFSNSWYLYVGGGGGGFGSGGTNSYVSTFVNVG